MGATCFLATDRVPHSVVRVVNDKTCVVSPHDYTADKSKPGGMGHQNWVIHPEPRPVYITITLRNDGKWREKGVSKRAAGRYWILGHQEVYYCWEV